MWKYFQLLSDDDEDEFDETEDESLMAEFNLHKENYYRNKLDYNVVTEYDYIFFFNKFEISNNLF